MSSIWVPFGAVVRFLKPSGKIKVSSSILTPPTCMYLSSTFLSITAANFRSGRKMLFNVGAEKSENLSAIPYTFRLSRELIYSRLDCDDHVLLQNLDS